MNRWQIGGAPNIDAAAGIGQWDEEKMQQAGIAPWAIPLGNAPLSPAEMQAKMVEALEAGRNANTFTPIAPAEGMSKDDWLQMVDFQQRAYNAAQIDRRASEAISSADALPREFQSMPEYQAVQDAMAAPVSGSDYYTNMRTAYMAKMNPQVGALSNNLAASGAAGSSEGQLRALGMQQQMAGDLAGMSGQAQTMAADQKQRNIQAAMEAAKLAYTPYSERARNRQFGYTLYGDPTVQLQF